MFLSYHCRRPLTKYPPSETGTGLLQVFNLRGCRFTPENGITVREASKTLNDIQVTPGIIQKTCEGLRQLFADLIQQSFVQHD